MVLTTLTNHDIIIGGGQVGYTLYQLFGEKYSIIDVDKTKSRHSKNDDPLELMHVCFPGDKYFAKMVAVYAKKYNPQGIVIHSTVTPGTCNTIHNITGLPVFSTPTRGVHKRFLSDMKRYTRFWAVDGTPSKSLLISFLQRWKYAKVKTVQWESTKDLEVAKIVTDTTYYGWLIAFRYCSDMICRTEGVNEEKVWEFAQEAQEHLGNRPKMYADPKGIGGHCVMPNLELFEHNHSFRIIADTIKKINSLYMLNNLPNISVKNRRKNKRK